MRCALCILFTCLLACSSQADSSLAPVVNGDITEYCDDDIFKPVCAEDEVIVIKHARYGRMRRGRCLSSSDHVGCSVDVRSLLDRQCSGKRSCEIVHITSITRQYDSPCGGDLKEYLEVALECIAVIHSTRESCTHAGAVEVRSEKGFLSSFLTHQTGCGSQNNPWWITQQPGKRIRLRLLDFAADPSSAHLRSNVCQVYAMVKEMSRGRDESVCASSARESVVYTSEGNQLEVQLITGAQMDSHFLLEFEAIGCADPNPPASGWIKREGKIATMGCDDNSGKKWQLRCEGTSWTGKDHNCTLVKSKFITGNQGWIFHEKYQALSIMIIIGVVICVCLCFLLVAVIYVKRNWKTGSGITSKTRDPLLDDGYAGDYRSSEGDYHRPTPGQQATSSAMTYPPPPYFTDGTMKTSQCTCKRGGNDASHDHERPLTSGTGVRKDRRNARKTDPKYYELYHDCIESTGPESL